MSPSATTLTSATGSLAGDLNWLANRRLDVSTATRLGGERAS